MMKKTNLFNLYNLLYIIKSRYNPQPLSESSDYITAKLNKDKIDKIEKITTSSATTISCPQYSVPEVLCNYLYVPQNHPMNEEDSYHMISNDDDTEGHTERGVIVIDI